MALDEPFTEVIIKYVEPLSLPNSYSLIPLYDNYGILSLPLTALDSLLQIPGIVYYEPSSPLYYELLEANSAACISTAQISPYNLTGKDVIVGIIDSGIDIYHPDFRKEDGTTRILSLWDQSLPYTQSNPYGRGQIFSSEDINSYLFSSDSFPSRDLSGHGTHVAGIAAGNGRASQQRYRGVAPEADLLIVKLGSPFSETTNNIDLMLALQFCVSTSVELQNPLALNLSLGNNAGSHTGDSLVETFLDSLCQWGKTNIIAGTGNEGDRGKHISLTLVQDSTSVVEFEIAPAERTFPLSLWWNYPDTFSLSLRSPAGDNLSLPLSPAPTPYVLKNDRINAVYLPPTPYRLLSELQLQFSSSNPFLTPGIWRLTLSGQKISNGALHLWLPAGTGTQPETRFLTPTTETTLTIPSTSKNAISVGAYNSRTNTLASFSGQGFTANGLSKPELVAPGVDIISTSPGGSYVARTGTSMAAPFVTGSCALLMEYGIIRRNDSTLYGQKLKAQLLRGAIPFADTKKSPLPTTGWGKLCLRNSLP